MFVLYNNKYKNSYFGTQCLRKGELTLELNVLADYHFQHFDEVKCNFFKSLNLAFRGL